MFNTFACQLMLYNLNTYPTLIDATFWNISALSFSAQLISEIICNRSRLPIPPAAILIEFGRLLQ